MFDVRVRKSGAINLKLIRENTAKTYKCVAQIEKNENPRPNEYTHEFFSIFITTKACVYIFPLIHSFLCEFSICACGISMSFSRLTIRVGLDSQKKVEFTTSRVEMFADSTIEAPRSSNTSYLSIATVRNFSVH